MPKSSNNCPCLLWHIYIFSLKKKLALLNNFLFFRFHHQPILAPNSHSPSGNFSIFTWSNLCIDNWMVTGVCAGLCYHQFRLKAKIRWPAWQIWATLAIWIRYYKRCLPRKNCVIFFSLATSLVHFIPVNPVFLLLWMMTINIKTAQWKELIFQSNP